MRGILVFKQLSLCSELIQFKIFHKWFQLTGLRSGDTIIRTWRSSYGRVCYNTVSIKSVRSDRCIMVSVPEWSIQFDQVDGCGRAWSLDSLDDVTNNKTVDRFRFVPTYCNWPRSIRFQYGCKYTFRNCWKKNNLRLNH